MNERIKKLVKQAGGHISMRNLASNPVQHIESVELWDDRIEKFAELIIRECVATLKEDMELAHIQLIPLDFKMYANGRLQRTIKDHFGVE